MPGYTLIFRGRDYNNNSIKIVIFATVYVKAVVVAEPVIVVVIVIIVCGIT